MLSYSHRTSTVRQDEYNTVGGFEVEGCRLPRARSRILLM